MIPPDSEAVFYGVLDFCSKVVFSIMLLVGHWNIDLGRLGLCENLRNIGSTIMGTRQQKAVVLAGRDVEATRMWKERNASLHEQDRA